MTSEEIRAHESGDRTSAGDKRYVASGSARLAPVRGAFVPILSERLTGLSEAEAEI